MASRTVTSALTAALKGAATQPADAAAVQLARRYATALDAPGCPECGGPGDRLAKLGPELLRTLSALAMTPAGRAAVLGKGAVREQPPASALDELRQRRATRQRHTTAVDTAAG